MPGSEDSDTRLKKAVGLIVMLSAVVPLLGGGLLLARVWKGASGGFDISGFRTGGTGVNMVREAYPELDFSPVYPGFSAEEIDRIQRETFGIRFTYAPFVQFRSAALKRETVEISPQGFRKNAGPLHPWPPDPAAFNVFVFGGSTTFGIGVPDSETVVAHLEERLAERSTNQPVRCYNFGTGFYFSSQERILFHDLLVQGMIPKIAVFIDGLNEFRQVEGFPEFTPSLHERMAPDLPPVQRRHFADDAQRRSAVEGVLSRYHRNNQLVALAAKELGVRTVFVGQPVPFAHYPIDAQTYPVRLAADARGIELCTFGYARFGELAAAGAMGPDFVWAAEAFKDASTPMYCDAVHYSPPGARRLAGFIVEKMFEAEP